MRTITARRSMFATLAVTVALSGLLVTASPATAAAGGFHSKVVFGEAGVPVLQI